MASLAYALIQPWALVTDIFRRVFYTKPVAKKLQCIAVVIGHNALGVVAWKVDSSQSSTLYVKLLEYSS